MARAVDHINKDFETLRLLSDIYHFKLNPEKAKIFCVASKSNKSNVKNNVKIHLGEINLQFVESAKKLRVTFNENLEFKNYLKNIIK